MSEETEMREIDVQIARKVFGFEYRLLNRNDKVAYLLSTEAIAKGFGKWKPPCESQLDEKGSPRYTTGSSEAMAVLKKCTEMVLEQGKKAKPTTFFVVQLCRCSNGWCVEKYDAQECETGLSAFATTFELAICQFALKLYGEK